MRSLNLWRVKRHISKAIDTITDLSPILSESGARNSYAKRDRKIYQHLTLAAEIAGSDAELRRTVLKYAYSLAEYYHNNPERQERMLQLASNLLNQPGEVENFRHASFEKLARGNALGNHYDYHAGNLMHAVGNNEALRRDTLEQLVNIASGNNNAGQVTQPIPNLLPVVLDRSKNPQEAAELLLQNPAVIPVLMCADTTLVTEKDFPRHFTPGSTFKWLKAITLEAKASPVCKQAADELTKGLVRAIRQSTDSDKKVRRLPDILPQAFHVASADEQAKAELVATCIENLPLMAINSPEATRSLLHVASTQSGHILAGAESVAGSDLFISAQIPELREHRLFITRRADARDNPYELKTTNAPGLPTPKQLAAKLFTQEPWTAQETALANVLQQAHAVLGGDGPTLQQSWLALSKRRDVAATIIAELEQPEKEQQSRTAARLTAAQP